MQAKEGSHPYQMPQRRVAYTLQELLKEEQERLQGLQVIVPLGFHETSEWYNSFMLVPKTNGKVKLCLDPARPNFVLIRPICSILPRLAGIKYFTFKDVSSGYHNLKLNDKSSYIKTFSCPFGTYQYVGLLFGASLVGDMFQKKIDELFGRIPDVFCIADDLLIAGFHEHGRGHDKMLEKVLKIFKQSNLKLNKD